MKIRIKHSCLLKIAAFAVLSVLAFAIYTFYVEPIWIQVTKYELDVDNLNIDTGKISIVQMADLHRGPYVSEAHIRKAVNISNKLDPDIVVLTGDFVSASPDFAESCANALAGLKSRYGVYAVLGNHDYWEGSEEVVKQLTRVGIQVMTNRNKRIIGDLWLVGLDDVWAGNPDVEKAYAGVPEDAVPIVITHSPKLFPKFSDRKGIVLTSHTHGGQFVIPGIPRNRLPGLRGAKYISGWYQEGKAQMYVNRGIGVVRPPIRFLCRPEITLFTLNSSEKEND